MAKFSYLWVIETRLGTWREWESKGRKGPQLDEHGLLLLGKKKYAVDPKKFRKWHIRNRFGNIKKTVYVEMWREDEPVPIDFFDPQKKVGDDITGTMLQRLSRIKRLDLIRNETQFDWQTLLLIASVIGNLGAIAFLISMLV